MSVEINELLKAGVHYGHQKSRWHPKMNQYIFGLKGGIHIVDLEKTKEALERAKEVVEGIVKQGGTILFLSTKRQSQNIVKQYAQECGMPYIHNRYIGGFITNFMEVRKLIRKYRNLLDKREKGELKKYTKKEQLEFDREIARLEEAVSGVASIDNLPELIFVIDIKHEKTAINEARKKNIPVMAICDTNVNPERVNYVIPGNDDATKAIEFYMSHFSGIIKEAKKHVVEKPAETKKPTKEKQEAKDASEKKEQKK